MSRLTPAIRTGITVVWCLFQMYIVLYPLHPIIQRPVHLFLAVILTMLFQPLAERGWRRALDWLLIAGAVATIVYYVDASTRLIERMEKDGLVGQPDHVGRRELLIDTEGHPI